MPAEVAAGGAARLRYGFMELPRALDETVELARLAEAAGYAWLGIADSPVVYQESYLHQAAALAATETLQVGALVSHVAVRHPVIVANLLATLQEGYGGRAIGTVATGNSAARGLGLTPLSVADLGDAVAAIRGYWAGTGATFRDSVIPASGIERRGCPLLVAGDGPRVVALAGERGDGVLYGGTLEPAVLARRLAAGGAGGPERPFWVAAPVSLGESIDDVITDMGAMLVAIANRAFRGDLTERGVPGELHEDVRAMWASYDYAFHADNTRPQNLSAASPRLQEYLIENFMIWGDEQRWRERLNRLAAAGCAGVMFVLGQGDQVTAIKPITERLRALGALQPDAASRAR